MGLLGFTITCCLVKFTGSLCFPESGIERFYLLLAGVFNFIAHVLKVFICKFENAAFGALLTRSIDVMITFLQESEPELPHSNANSRFSSRTITLLLKTHFFLELEPES